MSENVKTTEPVDTSWMDEMPEVKLPYFTPMADLFPVPTSSAVEKMDSFALDAGSVNAPTKRTTAADSQEAVATVQSEIGAEG